MNGAEFIEAFHSLWDSFPAWRTFLTPAVTKL